MAFELWEPFREAVSLRDAMNSLLQESFVRPGGGRMHKARLLRHLPLDVAGERERVRGVKASLPGVEA